MPGRSLPITVFLASVAILGVVHALTLIAVFPGFYDPLWPNHADYYIASSLVFDPGGFTLAGKPRPAGFVYAWVIGHLPLQLQVLSNLAVHAASFGLIVALAQRMLAIRTGPAFWICVAIFAFLVCAHPLQYEWASYDFFAGFSLLPLVIAAWCALYDRGWLIFVFAFLGFLAKETYALTFLAFGVAALLLGRDKGWRAAVPLAAGAAALAIAVLYNRYVNSVFLTAGIAVYEPNFSPASLASEWLRYLIEGYSPLSMAIVVAPAVLLLALYGPRDLRFIVSAVCIAAGALAWLPNAALPHHHFAGYSFAGAIFLFAPVLAIATLPSTVSQALGAAALTIAAAALPLTLQTRYARSEWALQNQRIQKRLWNGLASFVRGERVPDRKVLISGISSPFSPFDFWASILSLDPAPGTRLDVVYYRKTSRALVVPSRSPDRLGRVAAVIAPDKIDLSKYARIWLFKSNGAPLASIEPQGKLVLSEDFISEADAIAYPDLIDLFGPAADTTVPRGYRLLSCGSKLLDLNETTISERCLTRSAQELPQNPYPSFYLGVVYEMRGDKRTALRHFERAVALGRDQNPAFEAAVKRLSGN